MIIAPSILSADFGRLAEEIADVEKAGCDWIHADVMDGHFVPNLTIGPVVVRGIRKTTQLPLDVHLMIENPIQYVDEFRNAGSDWITIHVEAEKQVRRTLERIRKSGAKAGLSLKPGTPPEEILPYLPLLDLILVMTVEPGFGGQAFMPAMMEKVRFLRPRFSGVISVDGGVGEQNAAQVAEAGADALVAGTSVFGRSDRSEAVRLLRAGSRS
jgi:ribulose-phosphate 3-epimerase